MSSFVPTEVVEVRAWDRLVGAVASDPRSGRYAFEFDEGWRRDGAELSPLVLPRRPGVFSFPELDPVTFYGLPAMLADALPDRFGNALIDQWMASQGFSRDQVTALDRLTYTSNRGMGALTFAPPAGPETSDESVVALADLVVAAREALAGEISDTPAGAEALRQLVTVGTSAGGARAKAVIAFNPATEQVRSGQLDAPEGFEHWLIKLDGVGQDPSREGELGEGTELGVLEYAYYLMAREAGLRMSQSRLLREGSRSHFLTRRFDRRGRSVRVHMQSLCALAHLNFNQAGAHGYEQYLLVIGQLGLGSEALREAFRRCVFNVFTVNCDDHTKNLAFLLPEDDDWQLAPAFDVTFAFNPQGTWTSGHQMTVAGKRNGITVADLDELGDRFAVPGFRGVISEMAEVVDRWPAFAEQAGVPGPVAQAVGQTLADQGPL